MQSFEEEKVYLVYFTDTISRPTVNYGEQNMYICPCSCTAILPPCCQPVVQHQVKKKTKLIYRRSFCDSVSSTCAQT